MDSTGLASHAQTAIQCTCGQSFPVSWCLWYCGGTMVVTVRYCCTAAVCWQCDIDYMSAVWCCV